MVNLPQEKPKKFAGSSVVSAYPLNSGIGVYSRRLFELDLFDELAMYKIINSYPEEGFMTVVKHGFNPNGMLALLSMYFGSGWGSHSAGRAMLHITSPDWFHMVKHNQNTYGTIHDIFAYTHPEWFTASYRIYFRKEMEFAEKLKGVVAVSRSTQKAISESFPNINTIVIHDWTGPEFTRRDRNEARAKLGLPTGKNILLSVGSYLPRKNLAIIPKIMKSIGDEFILVRLGSFSFTARHELKDLGKVIVRENVSNELVPLYYNAANVLLAPSIEEGFDLPVIEAINSGLPVVASDIKVHREVMIGRGHYADPHAPDQWVDEIMKAIDEKDPWREVGDYYREGRALADYLRFYGGIG
ncbi:MAG: glycosyltransferase [Nitrososphaerota archaeon]|nr:glycosyltransferase [Nitrososphaerota archaeon]